MSPPDDIDGLSAAELKDLLLQALAEMADMQRTIAALRDEIARLKGGSGRPDIKPNAKPSGMEQATEPKPPEGAAKRRRGSMQIPVHCGQ
jgi:uncharacterized small protein (DUF1192 family)